jgi:hypothetical protein
MSSVITHWIYIGLIPAGSSISLILNPRVSEAYNRANASSLVHQLECFIDLIQGQIVSGHRINFNHAF